MDTLELLIKIQMSKGDKIKVAKIRFDLYSFRELHYHTLH